MLLIGSDSQFAAVGIRDRAHELVIGLAAVERTLDVALGPRLRRKLSSSHSAFFVRFFLGYDLSLAMMTLLSGHLQGQRGEDVLDINMLTVHQRRESNRPTTGF